MLESFAEPRKVEHTTINTRSEQPSIRENGVRGTAARHQLMSDSKT